MKKLTFQSEATIKTLSFILAASVGLTACEAPKASTSSKGTAGETGGGGMKTTGANGVHPVTSGGTSDAGTAGNTGKDAVRGKSDLDDLPQLSAVRTVTLSKLRDSIIICSVNGTPITVEAFKKEFRQGLLSLQAMLTSQPDNISELLAHAKEMGVRLTEDERKRLLETARRPESLEGKNFADFLKGKKVTEKQFDDQVLDLGLAFKTGTKLIESQLLSQMINRELLLQAAQAAGFYRPAMNYFIEFKHTEQYDQLLKSGAGSAVQLKDDIINHKMMVLMMEQIAKQSTASDDSLKQEYEKNKEAFRHGERLRLSHIVIAAPTFDNPPLESIRTQIKRQKPKIAEEELDKEEKVLQMQQHNAAAEILARAIKGEDFKALADRYTDDVQARAVKSGGDLGYLDLSLKVRGVRGGKSDQEKLCDAAKGLKVGEVAPDLVQTAFGWHIVKLTDKQPAGYLSFDEAKSTLKQFIGQQGKDLAELNWIKDKRKNSDIKLSDEFIQAVAKGEGGAESKPVNRPALVK